MLLSAVSVLVVAQSSSEIPEGLTNNPVQCSSGTVISYGNVSTAKSSKTLPQIINLGNTCFNFIVVIPSRYNIDIEKHLYLQAVGRTKIFCIYKLSSHSLY